MSKPGLPRERNEDWSDYQDRLRAQQKSGVPVRPRVRGEDWSDYKDRLSAQETSEMPIAPRAPREDWFDYRKRLKVQADSQARSEMKTSSRHRHQDDHQSPIPTVHDEQTSRVTAHPPAPEQRVQGVTERLARASGFTKPVKLVRDIAGSSLQGAADAGQDAVLVTHDLVRRLDDDELAYVLAHEIAHFEHEDSRRMKRHVEKLSKELISDAEALDERLKKRGRGFVVRTLAQIGHGAAGVAAGYVIVHGRSREHEQQADSRAIDLMTVAGFDPSAAPRALNTLHGGHAPDIGMLRTIGSTHPNPATRVAEVARRAAEAKKPRQ